MTERNKVILGLLAAATVGAIIGLLTAPSTGSETRGQIRRTTGKWVDSMGRLFTHAKDGVETAVQNKRRKMQSSNV